MSIFDWIPTIDEVMGFAECRLMGHSWKKVEHNGQTYIVCKVCGKVKQ